jgi:hypothetical protein
MVCGFRLSAEIIGTARQRIAWRIFLQTSVLNTGKNNIRLIALEYNTQKSFECLSDYRRIGDTQPSLLRSPPAASIAATGTSNCSMAPRSDLREGFRPVESKTSPKDFISEVNKRLP